MEKRKRIAYKAIFSLIPVIIILIFLSGIIVSLRYYFETKANYQQKVFSYTRAAADFIDGDTIERYYETGERDDYYELVRQYLVTSQKNSGIKYFYVFVPREEDTVYIWDADTSESAFQLGDTEKYMENGKENALQSFRRDPVEEITINDPDEYGYIASGCSPIFNSKGEPVALVAVDMAMEGFVETLLTSLAITLGTVLAVSITAILVMYYLIMSRVIKPIEKINDAAKEMVNSLEADESREIEIHTDDEIEELAGSFNQMDKEVRDYIARLKNATAEKERIGAELDMAKDIQESQLPSVFPAFPDRKEFDIYATMTPAKEVGGDFYDFFFVDEDHLALVMADVSGKGVPAALFMMMSKILINNYAMMGLSPHEVLERTNNAICRNNKQKMFVTVWLGIMEISTGKITASNAGHEYPIIRQAGGQFELFKDKHSFVIGAYENMKYKEYELTLEKGSTLFVYTDGVPEATNAHEELYGSDRLVQQMNQLADASVQQLLENVHDAVDRFVGDAPQFDDLTMLAITRK